MNTNHQEKGCCEKCDFTLKDRFGGKDKKSGCIRYNCPCHQKKCCEACREDRLGHSIYCPCHTPPPDVPSEKKCCERCTARPAMPQPPLYSSCLVLDCICHTPKEEWEERLERDFYPFISGGQGIALKQFIRSLLEATKKAERESWINQPANQHDERIRKSEQERIQNIIGLLRQWLNEKPADKLVTNEDIEIMLGIKNNH